LNVRVVRQNAETHAIREALVRTGGNISRTAELLGVTRPTLYDLMAKYGIRAEEAEPPAPLAEPAARAAEVIRRLATTLGHHTCVPAPALVTSLA
jgi:transposase-like protein